MRIKLAAEYSLRDIVVLQQASVSETNLIVDVVVRRFDCGSGVALIRTTNVVDVEKWNKVTIHRREWSAWIRLNNGTQVAGRSKVRGHSFIV